MRGRLLRDTSWGILDQALSSGSNVALTIVVARTVGPDAFGGFSLCFVVYMLVLLVVRTTGIRPFTIETAHADVQRARAQARALMGFALGIGCLIGCLCLIAGRLFPDPLRSGLTVLGVLLPGLLLQDAVRGIFFAWQMPRAALVNDGLWSGLQAVSLLSVLLGVENPPMALLMAGWGLPAAVAALGGLATLGTVPARMRLMPWLRTHKDLATPFAVNMMLTAAPSYVAYLVMPLVSSLEELAMVRGAYIFFGPLGVVFTGAAVIALPAIVRSGRSRSRRRMSVQLSSSLAAVGLAWGAIVVALPDSVGRAVLGDLWEGSGPVRLLLAISLVAEAVLVGPDVVLSSLRLPRRMTSVRAVSAAVTLLASVALAAAEGAAGLAAGLAMGYSVGAVLAVLQIRRLPSGVGTLTDERS